MGKRNVIAGVQSLAVVAGLAVLCFASPGCGPSARRPAEPAPQGQPKVQDLSGPARTPVGEASGRNVPAPEPFSTTKMTMSLPPQTTLVVGQDARVPVTITIPKGTASPSGIQFTLTFPEDCLAFKEATLVGFPAGKQVVTNPKTAPKNTLTVLIFGLDQNLIGSGAVVDLRFSVTAPPQLGWAGVLALSGAMGAAPDGATSIESEVRNGLVGF